MTNAPAISPDARNSRAIVKLSTNLMTDLAITERQLFEWYGLGLEQINTDRLLGRFIHQTKREVALSHRARTTKIVNFICTNDATAALEDWQLRHLAGLAAARYRLGVTGKIWTVTAFGRALRDHGGRWLPDCIPDAIWNADWGRIAVEYDAGSHRLETVAEKVRTYAESYEQQLWLCATLERCDHLRSVLEKSLPEYSRWRLMRLDWR